MPETQKQMVLETGALQGFGALAFRDEFVGPRRKKKEEKEEGKRCSGSEGVHLVYRLPLVSACPQMGGPHLVLGQQRISPGLLPDMSREPRLTCLAYPRQLHTVISEIPRGQA